MGNLLVCGDLHKEQLDKNEKLIKEKNILKNKVLGLERHLQDKINLSEINYNNNIKLKKELNILKTENMNLVTKNEELENKLHNLNKHTEHILSSFKTINGILDNYD